MRRRGRRGIRAAAVAALLALAAGAPARATGVSQAGSVTAIGAAQTVGSGPGLANAAILDLVVLVDESGSETPAKIADEKQAAGTIVQSMLNPGSRVTVVGFGGVNHVVPDQSPVDVACQPTIDDTSYLTSCVNRLHRRTEAEGSDTDYAAALGQAMSYFNPSTNYGQQSPPGAIKVILLMTDGAADVHRDTQQYGAIWQLGEQTAVNEQLAASRTYGVQVWPLGFGTDIGGSRTQAQALRYLNQVAANGAPAVCDKRHAVNQPHATWVNDPSDAISALNQLYADAACLGTNSTSTTIGGAIQTGTLSVTIPAIASDAAISVDLGSPGVQASFSQPDGQVWSDPSAISGQGISPVEVLHIAGITGGEVGTWQIHLTALPGLASQPVSATVFWQGAVRALIIVDPPSAGRGQPVAVTLVVLGPTGPITDPDALKNLLVGVTVSGDGLPRPAQVLVTRATASGVTGEYTGAFTVPKQQGTLTFTGTMAGYGLYVTQVPASVSVGTASAGFTAIVQFPVVVSVAAGSGITGHVIVTNQTSAARRVRLELITSGADASITSPSGPVTAPSGNSPDVPVTVSFAENSPPGLAWLQVTVVDAANPGLVYNRETLGVTVTKPPGFLARHGWAVVGILAAIVLAILALLWRREVMRRRKDVRGLIAILRRDGEQLGAELRAPENWSDVFCFIVRDEAEPTARLDYPQPGFSEYRVRRSGPGEVKLMTPATPAGGEPYGVVVGGPGETMDHNGLELAFRDTRRRGGTVRGRGPSGRTPQPEPTRSGQDAPAPMPPAPSAPMDEWL